MNDFAKLRKNTSIEKLTKALQSEKSRYPRDERYWELTKDKANNGWAEIRFLPAPPGEEKAWVTRFSHFFKGPSGKVYSELNRSTLGNKEPDPVSELNKVLWAEYEATGNKDIKERVSKQKRKLKYLSNILVVNDPAHPENNGKVFLFAYSKQIMDKIRIATGEAVNDKDEGAEIPDEDSDEPKFNAFCPWEGANLKIKCVDKGGYPNYEQSRFKKQTAIADSDEAIEKIWRSEYKLLPEVASDKFKSYAELKARLYEVLEIKAGEGTATAPKAIAAPAKATKTAESMPDESDEDEVPTPEESSAEIASATTESGAGDDDSEFSRFKELARMA